MATSRVRSRRHARHHAHRQELRPRSLRGRPREDPRVRARRRRDRTRCTSTSRSRATAATTTSSRRRCSPSSTASPAIGAGDVRPGGRHRLRPPAARRRRSSAGAPLVVAGDEITTSVTLKDVTDARRDGVLRLRVGLDQPARRDRLRRAWTNIVREAAIVNAGDELPELKVTADKLPDGPLRRRVGRLQPDPRRRRVRAAGRPARAHPARALDDGAGRAGAHRRRRRPAQPRAPRRQFRGMALPGARDHGHAGRSPRWATGSRRSRSAAEQDGKAIVRGAEAEIRACSGSRLESVLIPRQELILRKVVDCYQQTRAARGLEGRSAPTPTSAPGRRRSATSSRCSRSTACSPTRTRAPAASRPTRATATSSTACCPRPRPARRRARARAPRGRRGDARHHRDAVAGHEPAGDRLRAADRHRDDPPRRGPRCCSRRS